MFLKTEARKRTNKSTFQKKKNISNITFTATTLHKLLNKGISCVIKSDQVQFIFSTNQLIYWTHWLKLRMFLKMKLLNTENKINPSWESHHVIHVTGLCCVESNNSIKSHFLTYISLSWWNCVVMWQKKKQKKDAVKKSLGQCPFVTSHRASFIHTCIRRTKMEQAKI